MKNRRQPFVKQSTLFIRIGGEIAKDLRSLVSMFQTP